MIYNECKQRLDNFDKLSSAKHTPVCVRDEGVL